VDRVRLLCLLGFAVTGLLGFQSAVPFQRVVIDSGFHGDCKAVGDIDGDGLVDVVVGGARLYWYRAPAWTRTQIAVASSEFTTDMQVGDVDGDGDLDVIVPDGNSGNNVFWYQNPRPSGNPATSAWARHTIGAFSNWAHDLEVGDMNGDGKLDVVTRNGGTSVWLQNNPDSWTRADVAGATPGGEGTAVGDVDGDGDLDLALNGYWMENLGGGTSWTKRSINSSWPTLVGVTIADLNRDGRRDVILAASESTGRMAWYEAANPRTGPWTEHVIDASVDYVHTFKVGDADNDGDPDLFFAEMAQSSRKRVGFYRNGGSAQSWTLQVLSTNGSHNIRVADFGNDGDLDLVGANWQGPPVEMWENLSSSGGLPLDRWTYIQVSGTHAQTFGLAFGDVNGDGLKDIVSGPFWYRNPGGDMSSAWTRTALPAGMHACLVFDVDSDGLLDVVAQKDETDLALYWLEPTSTAGTSWTSVRIGTVPAASHALGAQGYRVADVKAGGRPEVLVSSGSGIYFFEVPAAPGAGGWPRVQVNANPSDEGFAVGDIDRDGDLDVAATTGNTKRVEWYRNPGTGAGSWTAFAIGNFPEALFPDRTELADLDRDGRLDIVVTEENGGSSDAQTYWWRQPADPTSASWTRTLVVSQGTTNSADVADMDGDGDTDLILAEHRGSLKLAIWVNNGTGGLAEQVVGTGRENHLGARAVDLDGDGDLDIVGIAYDASQYVHLWRNDARSGSPPPSPPNAPGGLSATAVSSSRIDLSWTDNSADETGFEIDRAASSSGPWTQVATVGAGVTSYSNTGLSASTTYFYRVRATNAAGDSANSNVASATTLSAPPPGAGTGPTGEYYENADLTGLVMTRTDTGGIDFTWGTGSPDPAIAPDTFSVRWSGRIEARYSETYTFYTNSDDGVRLWVDGQLIVDNWTDHAPTENSGMIALGAGQRYDLRLEYYESGGGAVIQLSWSSASQARELVPASLIYLLDSDGDGMADAAESSLGLDPANGDQDGNGRPDGQDDWDADGTDNATEIASGVNPGNPGGGSGGGGGGSGGGGCGATGLEALLFLLAAALGQSPIRSSGPIRSAPSRTR
jgi:hypothetical protein